MWIREVLECGRKGQRDGVRKKLKNEVEGSGLGKK